MVNSVQTKAVTEPAAEESSPKPFYINLWGLPGILALVVLILDQLTKFAVCRICPQPGAAEFVVIPGVFKLVHWRNLGAAWGLFNEHTWMLAVLSGVAAVALAAGFRVLTEGKTRFAIPFGILLGGIIGNFIDRAFFAEGVIDFIRVGWWPAFNVADSAICVSVFWIIIANLLPAKK